MPLKEREYGTNCPSIHDDDIEQLLEAIDEPGDRKFINGRSVRTGSLRKCTGTCAGIAMVKRANASEDAPNEEVVPWGMKSSMHLVMKTAKTAYDLGIDPFDMREFVHHYGIRAAKSKAPRGNGGVGNANSRKH